MATPVMLDFHLFIWPDQPLADMIKLTVESDCLEVYCVLEDGDWKKFPKCVPSSIDGLMRSDHVFLPV